MKHTNGQRRPEEIEAEIERTRSELHHTLDAIEQRLSPGQLVDQGLEYLRSNGVREYASNLGTTAKQDPVPLALVGVGLAWLMMSSRRSHEPAAVMPMGEQQSTTAAVKDKLSSASQRVSQTAQAARDRASHVGESARHQAQRLRGGYERMVEEQPLALGAIGLAIGAVLAATAPRTRTEERWVTGRESTGEARGGSSEGNVWTAEREEAQRAATAAADALRYGGDRGDDGLARADERTAGGVDVVVEDEPPTVQPYAPYVPPVR